jgi:hypothetical protein
MVVSLEQKLSDFFAEDREKRFFVKNLERVQGDERDAIILSIGYGKNNESPFIGLLQIEMTPESPGPTRTRPHPAGCGDRKAKSQRRQLQ